MQLKVYFLPQVLFQNITNSNGNTTSPLDVIESQLKFLVRKV